MSIFAIAIIATLAISLMTILVKLVLAVHNNVETAELVRNNVLERVDDLLYGKMLEKRGIDKFSYTHKVPLVEIEQEIKRCQECKQVVACSDALSRDSEQVMTFCPNNTSISQHQAVA